MPDLFLAKAFNKLHSVLSESIGGLLPLEKALLSFTLKPRQINFATTNICNAKCIFCEYQFTKGPRGIMSMEVFKKGLCDFIEIGGGALGLTPPVGDPLMDPLLLDRIRYARSFSEIKEIGCYTNAIALDRFEVNDILASGVSDITISFGGDNPEGYRRIFGVDEFEHAYLNIIKFAQANKKLQSPLKISLSLKIEKPLKEVVKSKVFRNLASLIKNISYQQRFDYYGGQVQEDRLPGIMSIRKQYRQDGPCSMFYVDGPMILYNGDVVVCGCRDLFADEQLKLGNILNEPLISLWQSDKLRLLREESFKGNLPKICLNCGTYNSLKLLHSLKCRRQAKENLATFSNSSYSQRMKTWGISRL